MKILISITLLCVLYMSSIFYTMLKVNYMKKSVCESESGPAQLVVCVNGLQAMPSWLCVAGLVSSLIFACCLIYVLIKG